MRSLELTFVNKGSLFKLNAVECFSLSIERDLIIGTSVEVVISKLVEPGIANIFDIF
jgi:hypothetical protein